MINVIDVVPEHYACVHAEFPAQSISPFLQIIRSMHHDVQSPPCYWLVRSLRTAGSCPGGKVSFPISSRQTGFSALLMISPTSSLIQDDNYLRNRRGLTQQEVAVWRSVTHSFLLCSTTKNLEIILCLTEIIRKLLAICCVTQVSVSAFSATDI